MRATYQLNNEKLEYNFRLLHEREYDHTQQIQQQKKKINRLQDMLSTLKGKYSKLDKKFRQKNMELTEEYKRVTEQYKDLRTKFRHFQMYDEKKYKEVHEKQHALESMADREDKMGKSLFVGFTFR